MNAEYERFRRLLAQCLEERRRCAVLFERRDSEARLVENSVRSIDESFRLIAFANFVLDRERGRLARAGGPAGDGQGRPAGR